MRRSVEFLLANEFWLASATAFVGILSPAWLPAALIVAALFWPLRRWAGGRWSLRTPVDWPVAMLVCLAFMTLWATAIPDKTLPQALRLSVGVALFYALVNWAGSPASAAANTSPGSAPPGYRLRQVVWLAAWLAMVLALAAPFVVDWATTKVPIISPRLYERFPSLALDTANPNVMAGSLALLLPLTLAVCLFAWNECSRLERILYSLTSLCCVTVLVLTQSRGAWIALAVGLAVMLALRWRWGWIIGATLAAGGILLAALVGFDEAASALAVTASLGSLAGRMEVWSRAVFMIQDFPFTGIGMGSFTDVADRFYPFFQYSPGAVEHAHNLLLQIAVDLGLLGLVAWLATWLGLAFVAWQAWRAGRRSQNKWQAGLGAGLFCSQVVLFAHGLTDAVLWGIARPAILVWLVWGMIASLAIFIKDRKNAGPQPTQ